MYSRGKYLPVLTRCGLVLGFLGLVLASSPATAASSFTAASGLNVRIYAGESLTPYLHDTGDALVLSHPSVGEIELYLGVDDPRFPRSDVTAFQALSADAIERALCEVHTLQLDLDVEVFVLPAPPVLTGSSFARRNAILLAPAYGPVDDSTVASVTVHELGHVLTWAYFDRDARRWNDYLDLRGLDAEATGPSASHAWRAREILAEDLRYLFGGRSANLYGAIENAELATPDAVTGLEAFLKSVVSGAPATARAAACTAFPNPCNPRTTVEMALPDGIAVPDAGAARLALYDARGRRVAEVRGGQIANGRLLISWDGRDGTGAPLASGLYHYVAGWAGLQGRGAVTLVK